ncbi:DUF2279 domain-containing protein [Rhodohalobacter mucosus]|uniref:DUF2279 domain-containing protein n=1 Tax=Rhodohalobacter mucosus TaxID=2079485 RepID=A0A316TSH7_9BACT|nr:DUF2279 domain-containing protein [Rhodohalobacter mucosus]PWN06591.1 DUF2279 domain-containing protein [Rhodohalobacter mucosus]
MMILIHPKKYVLIAVIISLLTGSVDVMSGQHTATDNADSLNTNRLRTVIGATSAFYAGGLYFLNNIWYKDDQPVPFHFYNDWSGWKQVDKAGHMYSSYYISKKGIDALRWAGVSEKKAVWLGGSMSIVMLTPIEIFDGLFDGYGFSVTDMIANTAGSALAVGQELLWQEQRIRMKFSYYPTRYPGYRPSYFGESRITHFFTDYNGHTYWLSANISSFLPDSNFPGWLDIAFGYGADGLLGEFENPQYSRQVRLPDFERTRQLYLSIDLNLEAIQTRSKFIRGLLGALNMIKIPAPAIEFNSSGRIKLHPVYF